MGVDKQIAIFSSTALSLTLSMISSFCLGIAVKGFFFGWGEDSLYHLTTSEVPCKGIFLDDLKNLRSTVGEGILPPNGTLP